MEYWRVASLSIRRFLSPSPLGRPDTQASELLKFFKYRI